MSIAPVVMLIAHLLGVFAVSVVLVSHRSCHDHDGEVVLIELWQCRAPIQEGSPLVFLTGILLVL
jgi:hypothetical protein